MTNPDHTPGLDDLIERLEKASEGSRELDRQIAKALDVPPLHKMRGSITASWPDYTTSLDAAMSLVPEGCARRVEYHPDLSRAYAEVFNADDGESAGKGRASTEPLALCIAALRARETTNGG